MLVLWTSEVLATNFIIPKSMQITKQTCPFYSMCSENIPPT